MGRRSTPWRLTGGCAKTQRQLGETNLMFCTGESLVPRRGKNTFQQLYGFEYKHFMKGQSNPRRFQATSVFPCRGIYCAGNANINPVEPKKLKLETISCQLQLTRP